MALKKIRKQSQTADMAATIHGSYAQGHSFEGAVIQAGIRYPNVSSKVISEMANKIYSERKIVDNLTSGNLGQFTNLGKKFGCDSDHIRFTTYVQFIDGGTGSVKSFWQDVDISPLSQYKSISALVGALVTEGLAAAQAKGYKPKEYLKGATAAEFIASGVLKITGFECM